MSKSRSITNEIRLSQSFAQLTLRQRDLWHGMIATADDQGRVPGHPAAVRSMVWPYDDILLSEVQKDLDVLQETGNILIYKNDSSLYIQIINWWKYQKMQWAGFSKYPAPDGWLDRVRVTGKGKTITKENWETPGGFFIATENVKVNDNVNVNPLKKGADKGSDKGANKGAETLLKAYFDAMKMPFNDNIREKDRNAIERWVESGCTERDVELAVNYATEQEYTIVGPDSIDTGVMMSRNGRYKNVKQVTRTPDGGFDF